MIKLVKLALFNAAILMTVAVQHVSGTAVPAAIDDFVPFAQFQNQRSAVGPDGNNRLIWDYYSGNTYLGSTLWILDPQGNFLYTGSASIPPVGNGITSTSYSNIALHVFPSNNTTLAFAYIAPNHKYVSSFATWTFNAQGQLIAAAGPYSFSGTRIDNISFEGNTLIVKWV